MVDSKITQIWQFQRKNTNENKLAIKNVNKSRKSSNIFKLDNTK